MNDRVVINVANGNFVKGQKRLFASPHLHANVLKFTDQLPPGSPDHEQIPFAFKAWALQAAIEQGYTKLLWCDACIKPARSLQPLWERIERDGYWIAENVPFMNWEWTAKRAYEYLDVTEEENKNIPHVVATAFGIDIESNLGSMIFDEYFRLAKSKAFCGPVKNDFLQAHPDSKVGGHRHDQTALSVIAHRLGLELTCWPDPIAYAGKETDTTILIADGSY